MILLEDFGLRTILIEIMVNCVILQLQSKHLAN